MPSCSTAVARCAAALAFPLAALAQTTWTPLPTGPGPRGDVATAFDPLRGQFLLQGGWNGTTNLAETWAFANGTWTQLAPSPGLTSSHRLAFLPTQGVVLAFGGWDGTSFLAATWAFDGTAWTVRQPAHTPRGRYSHAMVADTTRGVLVLFGGYCGTGCALDDTWEYDGTDWTQRTPTVRPTGRFSAGMAYDQARNHTLLFGGRTLAARVNDTWTWNGTDWASRGSGGPSARSTPVMDYDSARQRVVLFGGFAGSYVADTWEHDGTSWLQRTPSTPPPGRGFSSMSFDGNLQRMVLVGGETNSGVTNAAHSYGPATPATVAPFGIGCGQLTLRTVALPWLGDSLRIAASPVGGATVFALGFDDMQWNGRPLPLDLTSLGLTGCQLAIAPETTAIVGANGGTADYVLPIPNAANLLGVTFFLQAMADDATVLPAGVGTSAPARAVIGGR